jgi:beta-galactosidase GanA
MCGTLALQAQTATLKPQGNALQLQVDGQPFFLLGGELGNSSASAIEDIRSIFPRLQQMNLNAVLVPAYWDQIEPTEGHFDFTLTDQILEEARKHQLKVVFLWFGAWKNSMSCYTPAWFKQDVRRFPRAHTRTGKPLEIASVFSKEVFLADQRAFSQWIKSITPW